MKKIITLLSIIFCLNAKAQTWVTIPDANFVIYLHALVPTAMHGDSLNTSDTLVTTTTHTINISQSSITNLFGVQYFTSLTSLSCSNSPLINLPALPNSLQSLVLYTDSLTSIPNLPGSLTYLDCSINHLTSLPSLPNSLTYLNCGSNHLTSIPSLPSTIKYLMCGSNYLSNIPSLPNSIATLFCDNNSLTNLPTLPNSITDLSCGYNQLTNLPSLPDSLKTLTCQNNFLTVLPTLPNSLNLLFCQNNNIACFSSFSNKFQVAFFTHTSCSNNNLGFWNYFFVIDPNPYNCLPNYISSMGNDTITYPLCSTGNSNGCTFATGIKQLTFNNIQVAVYPNPTSDQFYIDANTTNKLTVDLFDVNGRHVFNANVNDKSNIDVTNLNGGIYTLTIKTVDGVINKKLVIVR